MNYFPSFPFIVVWVKKKKKIQKVWLGTQETQYIRYNRELKKCNRKMGYTWSSLIGSSTREIVKLFWTTRSSWNPALCSLLVNHRIQQLRRRFLLLTLSSTEDCLVVDLFSSILFCFFLELSNKVNSRDMKYQIYPTHGICPLFDAHQIYPTTASVLKRRNLFA